MTADQPKTRRGLRRAAKGTPGGTGRKAQPRGERHYFTAACGHKHRSAAAAESCPSRRYCCVRHGMWPVIEVTIRPGQITRTREVEGQ